MPCLPPRFVAVILAFAPLFFQRSWRHAEVLLTGAILAPGKRIVTSLLRIMGLAHERRFVNYHRVLNRAEWSAGRIVCAAGTAARRFCADRACYVGHRRHDRAPMGQVHRGQGHLPRPGALQPWALRQGERPVLAQPHAFGTDPVGRAGMALPLLTALAPSECHCQERGRRYKKLTD